MKANPSPLSDQCAALRRAAQDAIAPCWVPESVYALIVACLVRLFARLEEMVLLWQSGDLPAACARRRRAPFAPKSPPARRHAAAHARSHHKSARAQANPAPRPSHRPAGFARARHRAPGQSRPSHRPRRTARAPPLAKNSIRRRWLSAPYLLRYRNYTTLAGSIQPTCPSLRRYTTFSTPVVLLRNISTG